MQSDASGTAAVVLSVLLEATMGGAFYLFPCGNDQKLEPRAVNVVEMSQYVQQLVATSIAIQGRILCCEGRPRFGEGTGTWLQA